MSVGKNRTVAIVWRMWLRQTAFYVYFGISSLKLVHLYRQMPCPIDILILVEKGSSLQVCCGQRTKGNWIDISVLARFAKVRSLFLAAAESRQRMPERALPEHPCLKVNF